MRTHIIVDYSYLYYKYTYRLMSGKLTRLSAEVEVDGEKEKIDTSHMYYTIKEIEGFRKKIENTGSDVVVSICFDSRTIRKEGDSGAEYKAKRKSVLDKQDFDNIEIIMNLLKEAGHNVYKEEGYEADDLVTSLVVKYKDEFDSVIIYTSDLDLGINIDDQGKVKLSRYKSTKGTMMIDYSNFEAYMSQELKCRIKFNAISLYKCTVGDKSDNIRGIEKFGVKAFEKMEEELDYMGLNFRKINKGDNTRRVIEALEESGYLEKKQVEEALESWELVKPMILKSIGKPDRVSTKELRKEAYMKYNMVNLIE